MTGAPGERQAVTSQSGASPLDLEGTEGTSQHDLRTLTWVVPPIPHVHLE